MWSAVLPRWPFAFTSAPFSSIITTILGVTIVGSHAGELIAEYVLAMKYKLGLNKILGTIHAYPTMVEANKYAAGDWKKANKPEKLLGWVEKYHDWRRG